MTMRWFAWLGPVLLCGSVAFAQDAIVEPERPEAVITTSEGIDAHEGRSENIGRHEGDFEAIDGHESQAGQIANREGRAGSLDGHHATSQQMRGRVVDSERLTGMGAPEQSARERLDSAREKLRAARERHAQSEQQARAQAPAAAAPAADSRDGQWTARLDVAQHRVSVAQAVLDVWDQSYAEMIQADYPRGEARQKLIDSRDKARERLRAEQAGLPRLVEQARRAGVPPGVLEPYQPAP